MPHTSTDTGEYIPDYAEEIEMDWANDELQELIDCKKELEDALLYTLRHFPEDTVHQVEMRALIEEAFDEAFQAKWREYRETSKSTEWPTHIPPFGALRCDTPKKKADREWARSHAALSPLPNPAMSGFSVRQAMEEA